MKKLLGLLAAVVLLTSVAFAQDAPGTISGVVMGEHEGMAIPIPFAHVAAFGINSMHPVADAHTDSTGHYLLHVEYGAYLVLAEAFRFRPEWFDNALHRSEADPIEVTEINNPGDIDFLLSPQEPPPPDDEGTILGRIMREGSDEGIGWALVTALKLGELPQPFTTISGMNGGYEFHHLPPGSYIVGAVKEGWLPGLFPETLIVNNNVLDHIDIFLTRVEDNPGSISGTITDASTGLPLDDAHVQIRMMNHMFRMTETDDEGNYIFENVPSGIYHVTAFKFEYLPGEYPDSVVVDGNDISGINIALQPFVETGISGHVSNAVDGSPIEDADIHVIRDGEHHWHHMAETNEEGDYFVFAPPGEYIVQVMARGFTPAEYPEIVTVEEDGITENIDFVLTAINFGSIAGIVTDTSGNPIGRAIIGARAYNGHFIRHTRSDSTGAYLLEDIIPGDYRVFAHRRGYLPGFYPDTVEVSDGQDVTGIDIVLGGAEEPFDGFISGIVTDDSTGAPIGDAKVVAFGRRDNHHGWMVRHVFTDSTGSYLLDNLPAAPFKVFTHARGYFGEFYDNVSHFGDATPVTPNADNINFALSPREMGPRSIAGAVELPAGLDPSGSIVYASIDGQIVSAIAADIDGYYIFDDLEPGTYNINVFSVYADGQIDNPLLAYFENIDNADVVLTPTGTSDPITLPSENSLGQNFPNPFNSQTQIEFTLPEGGLVDLAIYNIAGQKIYTLANSEYGPGIYQAIWNGKDLNNKDVSSGVYYYKLNINGQSETRKMTLLK